MSQSTIIATVDDAAAESGGVCEREGTSLSQRTAARVSELFGASSICSGCCYDSDESLECTSANC